jgi:hypothetical protein
MSKLRSHWDSSKSMRHAELSRCAIQVDNVVRMNGVDNLKVNLFGWQRFMVEFHKSKIV